ELHEHLRVVWRGRLGRNGEPEPRSACADERGDGREHGSAFGRTRVAPIIIRCDVLDYPLRFACRSLSLGKRNILGKIEIHIENVEVSSRKEVVMQPAGAEPAEGKQY